MSKPKCDVPYTCPDIDHIIKCINEAIEIADRNSDERNPYSTGNHYRTICGLLSGLEDILEELRKANDNIRSWGIEQCEEKIQAQDERDDYEREAAEHKHRVEEQVETIVELNRIITGLEKDLVEKEDEITELEDEITELEDEITELEFVIKRDRYGKEQQRRTFNDNAVGLYKESFLWKASIVEPALGGGICRTEKYSDDAATPELIWDNYIVPLVKQLALDYVSYLRNKDINDELTKRWSEFEGR